MRASMLPTNLSRRPSRVNREDGKPVRIRVVTDVTGTVQAAIRFNDGETPGYCLQGLGCAH